MHRWAATLLFALCGCSASEIAEPIEHQRQPILGGFASGGADPAVVALVPRRVLCNTAPPLAICTGTLIAPSVVLTAAHCVEGKLAPELRVFFGEGTASVGVQIDVAAIAKHPSLDVALLRLAAPSSVTPIAIGKDPVPFVDALVLLVGFGVDESGKSGLKRGGGAKVTAVTSPTFRYEPMPSMTCEGDSGGPVMFDGKLIGISRSGDADCKTFGTAVLASAVRADFIDPFLAAPASTPPPLDASRDYCSASCTSDTECPAAMLCLNQRGVGMRCGFPSLQSGRFGPACAANDACGGGACVTFGASDCRCFSPCGATASPESEGGGCSAARSAMRSNALLCVAAACGWLAITRRFRRPT